jgi:hypothetical protein
LTLALALAAGALWAYLCLMVAAAILPIRVIPEDDPCWQAALRAPLDHGPVPEEERLAMEEATRGSFLDGDVVRGRIVALQPR